MKFYKCKKCGGKVNPYLIVRSNGEGNIIYICEKCDTNSKNLEEIAEKDLKAEEEWDNFLSQL